MTIDYPPARRDEIVEELHGHRIADPYRWLEDPESDETKQWLAAQADLFTRLAPRDQRLRDRIAELMATGSAGTPAWRGDRCFHTRRDPGQEHAVLYEGLRESERVLIDPMALDPSGTTTLDAWQPDKEGRLLAYQLSSGGDEESLLYVMDVATGEPVEGPIHRARYSAIAWLPGGEEYYYVRRLPADQVPAGEDQYHRRIYRHRVGTDPDTDDVLVFGEGREKTNYYSVSVSLDGRWLTVSANRGTAPRNDLWLADLTAAELTLAPVQEDVDASTWAHVGPDGRLYISTDRDAPRGRLCVADPADPRHETWRDLLPEDPEAVFEGYALLDGVLLATHSRHAISEVTAYDLATGERLGDVPLPGLGTVGGLSARPEGGQEAWFGYTDSTTPAAVHRYDARTGETTLWAAAPGTVELPEARTRQVTYTSYDGTEVRLLVVDLPGADEPAAGGERPTILYGYGGFNVSLTPAYSASVLAWVEAGGVYAVANLRGGSEEGEDWHRAGMLDRKQNVFDDFHAAAEWLISSGTTSPGRLAISGGSNGGLLIGAAITQRPELFTAAVCSAPLLDMVRYEHFGLGQTWNVEYGSAADPEQLGWLLAYSPYHNVRKGTGYPATLFTAFENDGRVDPLHARKMCAALQYATAGAAPILLRYEAEVGHSTRSVSRTVDLTADTLTFLATQTGLSLDSVFAR
jgi:prolyl oligopeptidase